ncbi:Serpentine receptor class delta-1 [Toxocara canis]|uniref:Serpentine receptor class delta-1 n=1 Tax=Toxocara canis TaxID=6265 RepID=A0A0B2W740_TOXCA|nr:Serpentine receptor class delta-1 [Toxocara canis]
MDDILGTCFRIFYWMTGTSGILLNGLLLFLILLKTPSNLSNFSVVIANTVMIDFLKAIGFMLLQPRMLIFNLIFAYSSMGPIAAMGSTCSYVVLMIILSLIFYEFMSMPFGFIYRYHAMMNNQPTKKKMFSIIAITLTFTIAQFTSSILVMSEPQELVQLVSKHFHGINLTDCIIFGSNGNKEPLAVVTLIAICVTPFPAHIVCLYFRSKVLILQLIDLNRQI